MTTYAVCFIILVLAAYIYLRKDATEWKLMNDRLTLFTSNYNSKLIENGKLAKEADVSNKALRESVMSQKNATDSLQDHLHRLQQSVLLLENKLKILQDQVTGFNVNLPQTVSIQVTKDVKNAITRSKPRKAEAKKPDDKVLRKRLIAGGRIKRNAGVSARS